MALDGHHRSQVLDPSSFVVSTVAEMGHISPAVVFQHCRELIESEDVVRYWNIRLVKLVRSVPIGAF